MVSKALTWSAGRPERRVMVAMAAAGLAALLAWAWWPSGQYQPVRASDHGTIVSAGRLIASPASAARPQAQVTPVRLSPGKHLAVAMIPVGGATKDHPAIFVIKGHDGEKPAVIVSDKAPSTSSTPTATGAVATSTTQPQGAGGETSSTSTTPSQAVAFPFKLPSKPGPNDSQALATNAQDGGIKYDIVYSVVTVTDGAAVDETNSAYALASCKACTTVAVSFQLVLIVGQSDTITPINVAEALNVNCPYCVTTAIADQIVVTVNSVPSDELLKKLIAELNKLNAISALGAGGTPEAVAQQVIAVQQEIEQELAASGMLTNSVTTTSTTGATPSSTSSSSTATTQSDGTATTPATDQGSTPATSTTNTDPQSGTASTTTTPSSTQSTTTTPSSTSSTTPETSTTTDTAPTSTTPAPSSTTPTP